jgi:ABC-type spermidine/putrescine transport system permease subunit II
MIFVSLHRDGNLSLQNYVEVLGNARTWALFRNSALLATLTTIVSQVTNPS